MRKDVMLFWLVFAIDGVILCGALAVFAWNFAQKAVTTHSDSDNSRALGLAAIVAVVAISIATAIFDAINPGVQFPFSVRKAICFPTMILGNVALFYWLRSKRQNNGRRFQA